MARYCRVGAALAVLAMVCALAPSASAVVVHSAGGRFFGVTPHPGVTISGAVAARQPGAGQRGAMAAQPAVTSASWRNLNYQGGPVLHSSAPYVIFWAPSGESFPADRQGLIQRYFTDVAADSTRATNLYAVNRQFTDQTGFADYRQTFDPSAQVITDTNAYPTPRDATNCSASTYATCLTDTQLQTEVSALIAADGLPTDGPSGAGALSDGAPIYFVVLPSDVDVCFADGSGTCASNYFCAYHSAYTDGADNVLYAAIPTLALDNSGDAKACQYDGNAAVQQPNGSLGDVALKYISHEDAETITDPLGTGWWNNYTGNENGDNCNDTDTDGNAFLPTLGGDATSGTLYNQAINGSRYYLQSEWSNGDAGCEMQPSSGTLTPRFAVPPGPRAAGTSLSFDPTLSSSSSRISSQTWDFGDGSGAVFHAGSTLTTASHTYSPAGDYTVTLTLVDNRGNLSSTSERISVGASPTASLSYSPAQPNAGDQVSFDAGTSSGAGLSYAWDFGDGTSPASGPAPSHTYANGGTYLVRLTVTDGFGLLDTATSAVTIADEPPVAAFTVGAAAPEAGQTVPFDGSSSSDPDGTISSYAWSFGDGGHGSGARPTHRYAAPGTYAVTLTVTDSGGQHSSLSQSLAVTSAPTAAFVVSPNAPTEGSAVSFDGTGSATGGSGLAIQTYAWSFGDGTTATGATPSHTYAAAGSYRVRLAVTDGAGVTNALSRWITVADEHPTAAFAIPSGTLLAGQTLPFDAGASSDPDGSITSYRWDFGDGGSAAGAAPSHTYATPGTYMVDLTVTDADGLTDSSSEQVTVVDAHPAATIAVSTAQPAPGRPIAFAASSSAVLNGLIVSYVWNFGDGSSATGRVAKHAYGRPGRYVVTLMVRDSSGASAITYRTVVVRRQTHVRRMVVQAARAGGIVLVSVDLPGTVIAGRHVVHLRHPGTAPIPVKLTPVQLQAVRRGTRLRVRVALSFVPARGTRVKLTAVVVFRSAPAARGHIAAALAR